MTLKGKGICFLFVMVICQVCHTKFFAVFFISDKSELFVLTMGFGRGHRSQKQKWSLRLQFLLAGARFQSDCGESFCAPCGWYSSISSSPGRPQDGPDDFERRVPFPSKWSPCSTLLEGDPKGDGFGQVLCDCYLHKSSLWYMLKKCWLLDFLSKTKNGTKWTHPDIERSSCLENLLSQPDGQNLLLQMESARLYGNAQQEAAAAAKIALFCNL